MSDSQVKISNIALSLLGEPLLTSLAEETKAARLVDLRYDDVRDAVLRAHPWNCATKRAVLTSLATAPTYGFTTAYSLPSDFLRLVETDKRTNNFRIEGRTILVDYSPVNIKYIYRVTDVSEMDDLLRQTIAARLAAEMALPLTADAERMTALWQQYQNKLSEARFVDAVEAPTDGFLTNEWIDSRVQDSDPFRKITAV
jgi:hypothetical protein